MAAVVDKEKEPSSGEGPLGPLLKVLSDAGIRAKRSCSSALAISPAFLSSSSSSSSSSPPPLSSAAAPVCDRLLLALPYMRGSSVEVWVSLDCQRPCLPPDLLLARPSPLSQPAARSLLAPLLTSWSSCSSCSSCSSNLISTSSSCSYFGKVISHERVNVVMGLLTATLEAHAATQLALLGALSPFHPARVHLDMLSPSPANRVEFFPPPPALPSEVILSIPLSFSPLDLFSSSIPSSSSSIPSPSSSSSSSIPSTTSTSIDESSIFKLQARLTARYPLQNCTSSHVPAVEVEVPPKWEEAIGGDVRAGRWEAGEVLATYAGKAEERLSLMHQRLLSRRELVSLLCSRLSLQPHQLSAPDYTSVAFLVEPQQILLRLEIPWRYPRADLRIQWESLTHTSPSGAPMCCELPMGKKEREKEPTPLLHATFIADSLSNQTLLRKFKAAVSAQQP